MKFGFVFPGGLPQTALEYAQEAEQAGWDGFFMWEPVWGIDAWVSLGAIAAVTRQIRLGTMLTPLSRMRPWKLASETVTLDLLSDGRVILAVGLGAVDTGFTAFGEVTDRKTRAELLDEGLDILTGLWKGQPFSYKGKHYRVKESNFMPPPSPVQQPRIPIWVVGLWKSERSMQRVLRYDGLLPYIRGEDGKPQENTPEAIREMKAYIEARREAQTPFDIVVEGTTPGDKPEEAASKVRPLAEAGATWWIEAIWDGGGKKKGVDPILERIRQGPPRL